MDELQLYNYRSNIIDIVNMIENNPITLLSQSYNNKFINKIKETFTEAQQQLFVSSFYCYLKYHPTNDYVVDLDNIWNWIGFSTKQNAKVLLEKNFIIEKDYKILFNLQVNQKNDIIDENILLMQQHKQTNESRGGHNKQKIMLNIRTFKLFCIKAGTQKANELHEYFVKLEDILHQIIQEETDELKIQLQEKTKELENKTNKTRQEKEALREKTILEQFKKNVQCIYYGYIDNTNEQNEKLIKFGQTNDLHKRIKQHKMTFINFRLVNAFRVDNKQLIENEIKNNKFLHVYRRNIIINNINQTEILTINNGLTITDLDTQIKNIILSNEFTKENFTKLLEENIKLKENVLLLREENEKLQIYNNKLIRNYRSKIISKNENHIEKLSNTIDIEKNEAHVKNTKDIHQDNNKDANNNTNFEIIKCLTRNSKQKDGYYHVDGKIYKLLFGTREQVWNETAYKTSGELKKNDLMVNKYGKIVSKLKYITSKNEKRLDNYNKNRKLLCGIAEESKETDENN